MWVWLVIIAVIVMFVLSSKKYEPIVIEKQYSRPYIDAVSSAYEKREIARAFNTLQNAVNPSELGDPIIYPRTSGPVSSPSFTGVLVYDERNPGPRVGEKMNVPVPQGTLAQYSYPYNKYLISSRMPAFQRAFAPTSQGQGPDFPWSQRPLESNDFFKPYGPNTPPNFPSFVGNVSSFAPVPEVITPWEKAGLLISETDYPSGSSKPQLMNLYRRPIAPLQDLWEYNAQDADGFVIRLDQKRFLENGDVISHIPGKPGTWKVNLPSDNKYVWV